MGRSSASTSSAPCRCAISTAATATRASRTFLSIDELNGWESGPQCVDGPPRRVLHNRIFCALEAKPAPREAGAIG